MSITIQKTLCMGALALIMGMAQVGVAAENHQIVTPVQTQKSVPVNPDRFTGKVWSDGAFRQVAPARVYGGYVTFEPGARTDWHIHPLGQTLVVTFGVGLTQEWGGPVKEIRAGDVVVCPPGVKHWHGARPDSMMQHLAIGERHATEQVKWLEKVDDKTYRQRPQ